ncbi:MAG: 3'(2'),5'-bisphosphate nucleotidase CysQ, partial [Pseudobdellovibrionaceae bacterium]
MPDSALFNHLPALLNRLKRLAIEAGEVTLDYFDEGGYDNAMVKEDGSPLTLADQAAEDLITAELMEIDPSVPIIGEEAAAQGKLPELGDNSYFWLVDPLDGTKEFISGSGDYTVNIALIKDGKPLLGIVYAPFHGELYSGIVGQGAWRWLEDNNHEKDIRTRKAPKEGLSIVASKSHGSGEKLDKFLEGFKINKLVKRGSSLKI